MYRKSADGWLKHMDFIMLDMLCLQLAFLLSFLIRHGIRNPYAIPLYRNMAIFIELADIMVLFFFDTLKNVLKRGYYQEFAKTVKHAVLVELISVLYLFTVQLTGYSRFVLYATGGLYAIFTYLVRVLWKRVLRKRMNAGGSRSLLVVTTEKVAPTVIENIQNHNYEMFHITGLVIVDQDMEGKSIEDIPVVASCEVALDYVCREWVDEVFVVFPPDYDDTENLAEKFIETGVTVHVNLVRPNDAPGRRQLVEKVGKYTVLTTSINYATPRQEFMKRVMDISGGLVGCIFTGIIFLFVAPIIYISSPGPIFFSQVRIGKNGKRFKMYKFRSMYMDAEERKKELMAQNRVKDGRMFKVEFDTRVIGNKILPDGTKKTGIGNFIRVTSLDEFPQFFNVLKGDMSLVGTRPPTLDEWEKYEPHHRARMATKPGITGIWQVSGRSGITDFEEVVKLDTQYITEWSMGMDIKILLKTFLSVVRRDGSM